MAGPAAAVGVPREVCLALPSLPIPTSSSPEDQLQSLRLCTDGVFGRCQKLPVLDVHRDEVPPGALQHLRGTLQTLSRTVSLPLALRPPGHLLVGPWEEGAGPPRSHPAIPGLGSDVGRCLLEDHVDLRNVAAQLALPCSF
ncbi:Receptor-type tyrosine-protein phosphatase N2 [Tupaia chinensis]|uniref:Receptor-type tyrosine-protein phosphatase N2 n=1 Tax=Tupaia chinensis TaxID=246437 RepID=L9L414_TUPCH|nr:Receptor-type tyrosine-protein phosphatase N2 [Tupaia chinensis]